MSSPVWFENPQILLDPDRLLEFWPTMSQTEEERVNATTRFIIYATVIILLLLPAKKRDFRVVLLSIMIVAAIWAVYYREGNLSRETITRDLMCRRPTEDNPMANVMVTDYGKPTPPPACFLSERSS